MSKKTKWSTRNPPLPNACPAGFDPRHCDRENRIAQFDPRYYICKRCGKRGQFEREDRQQHGER